MSKNGGIGEKRIPGFRRRECRLSDPVPVPRHPQQFSVTSQRPDLHMSMPFFALFFSLNFFLGGGPMYFNWDTIYGRGETFLRY